MKNNIVSVINILKELRYILNENQKKYATIVLFVSIISSFFELLGVTAILPFVQSVVAPDAFLSNNKLRPIFDVLNINESNELMLLCGIGLVILYLAKNSYIIFANYIQADFATKVQRDMSVKMLDSYLKRPYEFFMNVNSSIVLQGCNSDTILVYDILSYLFSIGTEILTMTLIGGFIVVTDFWTAVGILILMGIVMLGMVLLFKPAAKRAGKMYREAEARKNKAIYQTISGVKEIFVMQRKEVFSKEYECASDNVRKAKRTNRLINECPDRIIEGVCVSGLIGIICIRLFINDNMVDFVPKLAAFAMAAFKVLPSIGKITSRINGLVYNRPGLSNVYQNMKEAEYYEKRNEQYARAQGNIQELEELHFEKNLMIQNVMWQYEKQASPVLSDVSLEVKKGESIALIGASGAGKTTLADVVLGLLKPKRGMVLMDGVDVFSMPKTWARIVGYVPQTVFLIDDTIRNNIAFGLNENQIDDIAIWDALERAQLKTFVETLPDGLDTIVGERGVKFSGGQRQRVAIARALYNRPEILVLDEATAALDNETETAVMESIDALQGQITMVIVAHRLTTIRNCDRIYEIQNGTAIMREKEEILAQI